MLTSSCLDTFLFGHLPVWTFSCVDTFLCGHLPALTCVGAAELWQAEDGQGQQQEEKVIGGQGKHQAVEGSHSWVIGGLFSW